MIACDECGMRDFDDDAPAVREHDERHRLLAEAARAGIVLQTRPGDHESAKRAAFERLDAATTDAARLEALETLCRLRWERSMRAAIGRWREHPRFERYARAYGVHPEDEPYAPIWFAAHPHEPDPGLPAGASYWSPPSRRR